MVYSEEYSDSHNNQYIIKVGENASENWNLIDESLQKDIWIHLDNLPSPHVVIQCVERTKTVSREALNRGGLLCKQYSKYGSVKRLNLIYTEIKWIRKGNKTGSVITRKDRSFTV